jgi:DNA polymerase elongation subunit (family B)
MKFYTNVYRRGNSIYIRGHDNGRRFTDKIQYQPTFYIPTKDESEYRTLTGKPVNTFQPGSIRDAKDFIDRYKDAANYTIYGSTQYAYTCLNELYGSDYDREFIRVANIDIEVASEDGFPYPEKADQPITAITVKMNGVSYVLGVGEYTPTSTSIKYINCKTEDRLILKFIDLWRHLDPDIVTGWNVQFFDIPYLYNRIQYMHDTRLANMLSPLGFVTDRHVKSKFGQEQLLYDLAGIEVLDYLELYKKFTYTNQESYRLDHIANIEVGEKKLDYSEFSTLHQLYKLDYPKFIEYNIKDVDLVERIDDKMKLIDMALAIAYDAKVNYSDTFTQVRMWDVLIHNYLLNKKIVIPPKAKHEKESSYVGAYVKDPIVGMHKWIMSFDLNSLYPHLIMQYNISPETFINEKQVISIEDIINRKVDTPKDKVMAANGYHFSRDKQGFLPEMMQKMYNDRVIYKQKMIESSKKYEKTKSQKDANDISKYHNLQLAKKVQLNSAYGALGNKWFRFFDVRQAEAITLSGQLSIKWIERRINEYLNKVLATTDVDYVVASDTDSLYISFDKLVSKSIEEGKILQDGSSEIQTERVVSFLDRVARQAIEPFIDKSYKELAVIMNAYDQKMIMAREVIADKGIWTAKKRYILNVHDSEGVRYAEPKLKMMGIEAVKSSTPQICRDKIKEAWHIIMNEDEQSVQDFIRKFQEEFSQQPFEAVAFPRGISTLVPTISKTGRNIGIPIHVRGSLLYNDLINDMELNKKYELIKDGEKIKFCYLKLPNPVRNNVISIINVLPKEFGIEKYIDYNLQFGKTFLDPIRLILDSVGWKTEKQNTLEALWQ